MGADPVLTRTLLVLLVGAALLFLGGIAPSTPAVASHGGPAVPVGASVPAVSSLGAPAVGPDRPLIVNSTEVLANGTVVPGNYYNPDGQTPTALALDAGQGTIFAATTSPYGLVRINDSTDLIVGNVTQDNLTTGLAFDAAASELFDGVWNCTDLNSSLGCLGYSGFVNVLNATLGRYVASVGVNGTPRDMAVDPADGRLFVPLSNRDCVAVIDLRANDSLVADVPVGIDPWAAVYDPATGDVYVANNGSGNVTVVSAATASAVADVGVGVGPTSLVYDPGTGEIFVGNSGSNNTSVILASTNLVVATVGLAGSPTGLSYDGSAGEIFVSWDRPRVPYPVGGNVSVLSDATDTVVGNVTTSDPMGASVFDPARNELFVEDLYQGFVDVVSPSSEAVVATVLFSTWPIDVAFDTGRGEVFVTDPADSNVTILSAASGWEVARVALVVGGPLVYDAGRAQVFVAGGYSDDVSVISDATNSVTATIALANGSVPGALAYDPGRGEVFVADSNASAVSVINDTTDRVVATVAVGSEPDALAYDARTHDVWVGEANSSVVDILSDATDSVVAHVSLSAGSNVSLLTYDPRRNAMYADNGNLNLIDVISDRTYRVVTKLFLPRGTNVNGMLYDTARSEVLFTDSGLNNASTWDTLGVINDADNRIVQWVPTGPDSRGAAPSGLAEDPATGTIYVANQYQGTLSLVTPSTLTFLYRGPQPGWPWSVTGGTPVSTQNDTFYGARDQVSFLAPNGLFQFSISVLANFFGVVKITGPGDPTQTSVRVEGPTTVVVTFGWLIGTSLTFNETGLPPGSVWNVSIAPTLASGPAPATNGSAGGTSISFTEPTGASFRFQVSGPAGFRAVPSKGTVSIPPFGESKAIRFEPYPGKLASRASGLPPVALGGVNLAIPVARPVSSRPPGRSGLRSGPEAAAAR